MDQLFDMVSKELMVVLVAAMPVAELRAAIPLGVSLGINPTYALLLGILGSMLPVPFLLFFLKPVFAFLRKSDYWRRIVDKITHRTMKKSKNVQKYKALGLILFVGIPLPGTGVWTGSLAALLINIKIKHAFLAILIGNIMAGVIMTGISSVAVSW